MKTTDELKVAIINKNLSLVKSLVNEGVSVNKKNQYQESAVITAILEKNIEILNFLLENGGDLERKFKKGYSALHYAVQINSHDICEFLISKGADVNALDNFNNTPLWYCCAIWNNDYDKRIIRLLLDNKADITIKNKFGLDISSWFGKKDGLEDVFKSK